MDLKTCSYHDLVKHIIEIRTGVPDAWKEISSLNIEDVVDALEHAVNLAQTLLNEKPQ